ncbi:MAG: UDP-N-acetylmuramate dehydrogenase [Bacilli bacterium]|jgi:UDP-N-acetylmuramate dehydrogenase|nr:UDP-N-acetylmuramate dehydrogenase [Bacilli bacterium]
MDIKEIKKLKVGEVLEDINLKQYTTYKAGGIGKVLVIPNSINDLVKLLNYIKENKLKYKILGFGSNLIFTNEVYDGILIKLDKLNDVKIEGTKITVGAGYSLIKLSLLAAKNDLAGLEFASGIPGTVGGAVFMNAGAYKSDMGYIVTEIKVLTPDLEVKTMYNNELDFHYRTSFLQKNRDYVCLEATLVLYKGKKEAIMNVIRDRKLRRLESQPLEYPSAGSVFRNPEGDFAGRLIEEIGYKGKQIGGAMVSTKHANFIINVGGATGKDIKKLITDIQEKIKKEYNIELKVEQEFVE